MASLGMQMLASALALLGWVGVIMTCAMPMWRVTAFVGSTIVTSQTIWEGIWMSCVVQSTGQIQCKPYDSMLALSSDLQAARALTVVAVLAGALGLLLAFVGGKCTRFLDDEGRGVKAKVCIAAGAVLMATGLLCLIPVSWSAGAVVRNFYSTQVTDSQRREIGAAIYIGWGASILLFLGGGMLCSSTCPLNAKEHDENPSVKYLIVRSSGAGSSMAGSQRFGAASGRSLQNGPLLTRSPWSNGTPVNRLEDRAPSIGSKRSEGASTKSQLKRADSLQSLAASQPSEAASMNPTKTYI